MSTEKTPKPSFGHGRAGAGSEPWAEDEAGRGHVIEGLIKPASKHQVDHNNRTAESSPNNRVARFSRLNQQAAHPGHENTDSTTMEPPNRKPNKPSSPQGSIRNVCLTTTRWTNLWRACVDFPTLINRSHQAHRPPEKSGQCARGGEPPNSLKKSILPGRKGNPQSHRRVFIAPYG